MEHRFCMRAKLQRYYDVTGCSSRRSRVDRDASEDSAFGYRGLASGEPPLLSLICSIPTMNNRKPVERKPP